MSPRQPVINAKDLIKVLRQKGFYFERQSGSYAIYINSEHTRVTIPIHGKKDLGKGLLRQILTDAKISPEEFRELI